MLNLKVERPLASLPSFFNTYRFSDLFNTLAASIIFGKVPAGAH